MTDQSAETNNQSQQSEKLPIRQVTPEMIETILSVGEDVINSEQLSDLLKNKPVVRAYDGFEPSGYGKMSIAQGLMRAHNTNKLTSNGVHFVFWVADWFAQLNHKMGGNLEKIQQAGHLMIETWKACGMDVSPDKVSFIWASEEINRRSSEYWPMVLDVATKFHLPRLVKCTKIMGRESAMVDSEEIEALHQENYQLQCELALLKGEPEPPNPFVPPPLPEDGPEKLLAQATNLSKAEPLSSSAIFYAAMQCADPFFLNVDILSLGVDQRKVTTLSLEYVGKCKADLKAKKKSKVKPAFQQPRFSPVVLHHHMLMGLDGSDKMSKSDPDNTIFMDDSPNEVKRKIKKAFCRPGVIHPNPMLEYCQYIILPMIGQLHVNRKEEEGGPKTYTDFRTLEDDFKSEQLHPSDLKPPIIEAINGLLQPVRDHFEKNPDLKKLAGELKKYQAKLDAQK